MCQSAPCSTRFDTFPALISVKKIQNSLTETEIQFAASYRYIHKLSIISVWPFSANRYTRCATTCCCIQQIQIQLNYAKVSFTGQQLLLMMIIMMLFDDRNSSNSHGFSATAADEHF